MKKLLVISCCMFFFNSLHAQQQLSRAEYFFNTDPGIGNGIPIVFTAADSIDMNVNITLPNTLKGLNVLFVRVANLSGTWSFPEVKLIWVSDAGQNIVAGEYFFDTDPGIGNGTSFIIPASGDSVNIIQNITVPALSIGLHKLYVRTKSSHGTWSFPEMHTVNICTSYGPESGFSYYVNGSEVYFTDSSRNVVSRTWSFGDNSPADTSVNPRHVFPQGSTYAVKLKTTNACGVDSVIKSINISGVQKITPARASSTGLYIGYIKGSGFKPGAKARWLKDGNINILADTTIFIDSTVLKVIFQNKNEITGQYDLLVNNPGLAEQTLQNAVTIEAPVSYDIWASLVGRKDILVNRWITFRIAYGNKGNSTALGVPIALKMPGRVEARLLTHVNESNLPQELIDATTTHFYSVTDSLTNDSTRIGYFIIPYLEPGASGELVFEIRVSNAVPFRMQIFKGNPLYSDSADLFASRMMENQRQTSFCDPPACIKLILDLGGFAPGISCGIGVYSIGCSINNMTKSGSNPFTVFNLVQNVSGAILSCIPGGAVIGNAIKKAAGAVNNGTGAASSVSDGGDCLDNIVDSLKPVFSYDPNVKTGPHGFNTLQYTRWQDPFNYTIHFENLSSATAPASEVFITDYLDTTKYDMSSFRFTGFGFAGTSVQFTVSDKLFIKDIDLRPSKQSILRVTGSLDSVNKLWFRFTTMDPATMRLTDDISQGFLNPNVDGAEGMGYVKFQIRPKSNLTSGTNINNTATIVFDVNPPIQTDVWFNGIDKTKPQSTVLPVIDKLTDTSYNLQWTGSDIHAGIREYSIYISVNDSAYRLFTRTENLNTVLTGRLNNNYKFYSLSTDFVGNVEDPPSVPDQELMMLPSILPVRWLEFRAAKQGMFVMLNWRTSFEQNNRGFEIQHSSNGINFKRIGWVKAVGNTSSGHYYNFIDSTPAKGKNYYRLKQTDMDNRTALSEIRRVDFMQSSGFILYPDPVKDHLNIQFRDNDPRKIIVQDMLGRKLLIARDVNQYSYTFPVQQLVNGLYLLIVIDRKGKQSVQKFIKQ